MALLSRTFTHNFWTPDFHAIFKEVKTHSTYQIKAPSLPVAHLLPVDLSEPDTASPVADS
jgi:hypothetical protein